MTKIGILALSVLTLLSACHGAANDSNPQKNADASKDIAMVEQMSKAPLTPIIPKPITPADSARYGLDKPGCEFRKHKEPDPIFFAGASEGFMQIGGTLTRLAAKEDSAQLPENVRTSYIGLKTWVDLVRLPDGGTDAGQAHFPARLIIHDSQERVAFMADGEVDCHD